MNLNEVFAFVSVVQAGSFTEAGRRLAVPKSTLSKQVARLEERLGARLLQRTTRRLSLTETGAAYFERCRGAIEDLEGAEQAAQHLSGQPRGTLRVSCASDAANMFVAPLLGEFRRRYPELALAFVLTQRRIDLVAEGFDVAIRGGTMTDTDLVARKLGESDIILCASPRYLERRGTPRTFEELSQHDGVMMNPNANPTTVPLLGPGGPAQFPAHPVLVANEWSFLIEAMTQGLGIGPMIVPMIREHLASGRLVRVLPEYGLTGGGLFAVYPSRHHLSPKVRVFVDFLVEHVGEWL